MITFELETPTTLYLLQFFGSIFPTRIFFWCTIRSHAYHCLFPCYLLEMSLGDWADKPLIKSICVGITYTLMETECCTRRFIPAILRGNETYFILLLWRDHFPRQVNTTEDGFCCEKFGWCVMCIYLPFIFSCNVLWHFCDWSLFSCEAYREVLYWQKNLDVMGNNYAPLWAVLHNGD